MAHIPHWIPSAVLVDGTRWPGESIGEVAEALLGPPLRENRPRHNPPRSKWGTTSQSRRPGDLPLPSRARQTERFTCARLPLTPVCFLGTFGARGSVPASLLKARGTAGPCSESLPARRISDFLRFSPSISAWYSTAFCCRCPHALAQVVSLSGRYL